MHSGIPRNPAAPGAVKKKSREEELLDGHRSDGDVETEAAATPSEGKFTRPSEAESGKSDKIQRNKP